MTSCIKTAAADDPPCQRDALSHPALAKRLDLKSVKYIVRVTISGVMYGCGGNHSRRSAAEEASSWQDVHFATIQSAAAAATCRRRLGQSTTCCSSVTYRPCLCSRRHVVTPDLAGSCALHGRHRCCQQKADRQDWAAQGDNNCLCSFEQQDVRGSTIACWTV